VLDGISLQDLRGYSSAELTFGSGPQLVVGPNAAGKTSLVEAIVLSRGAGRTGRAPMPS
jgi:recombinational DNA repair ATPase RecF